MLRGYSPASLGERVDILTDSIPPYHSLIGLSVRGVARQQSGSTTLTVNSTYYFPQCKKWDAVKNPSNGTNAANNTWTWATDFGYSITPPPLNGYPTLAELATLKFFDGRAFMPCDVHSSVSEVQIQCTKPTLESRPLCQSTKMRAAPGHSTPSNASIFTLPSSWYKGESYLQNFLHGLATLGAQQPNEPSSKPIRTYLIDPTRDFSGGIAPGWSFSNLDSASLEARLGLLTNTFWGLAAA
ncbi:hypothetical protein OQA88_1400 [Cercophora sp. LCS_1]